MTLPSELEIPVRARPVDAQPEIPGSKSLSNRALLLAALASGQSRLAGVLDSDDIRVMIRALGQLGAQIERARGGELLVTGVAGAPRAASEVIDVHASGTAARFLTALLTLVPGRSVLDGTARLRERPIFELLLALQALGADVRSERDNGCPPVICRGGKLSGGEIEIDASRSSQYVSAVLQVAPYAERDTTLRLRGGVLASRPYVELTLQVMRRFGAKARFADDRTLTVSSGDRYVGTSYVVEPDASTAAYFFAAAAITGGRVVVRDLPGDSAQADMGFLDVLARMGATVVRRPDRVEVRGPTSGLAGVDVDMNAMPDAVLAAAVTAAFASGPSHIRNVANLRIKESDRLAALQSELRKVGARAVADEGSLRIEPGPLHGATIDTYDDHRMAMAFALVGLRVPGVVIRDPRCVSKSWPAYFDAFARL